MIVRFLVDGRAVAIDAFQLEDVGHLHKFERVGDQMHITYHHGTEATTVPIFEEYVFFTEGGRNRLWKLHPTGTESVRYVVGDITF